MARFMKAAVFVEPGRIALDERPIPEVGPVQERIAVAQRFGADHVVDFRKSDAVAEIRIITTLCPGGKERMRRLMDIVASKRADLKALVTHRFKLDNIVAAYDLFSHQRDGVLKVAITP
jgi:Zn-dependent alcohol dehydrogenase